MFTLSGQRVFTLTEVAALTDTPERTVRWRAAQGWLRVQGGPSGRLVTESDLRAYCEKRHIPLQLPDDLTEEEREELEARRAEAIAREQRAQERYEADLQRMNAAADAREFDALAERMRIQQAYDRGVRDGD